MNSSTFGKDVVSGLSQNPKRLSSKYFYDKKGDDLFRKIMRLDEYYLTRSEKSIFEDKKEEIQSLLVTDQPFRLIELGAGDGAKTKVLIEFFLQNHIHFSYSPVDISANVVTILVDHMKKDLPQLHLEPVVGDYFKVLQEFKLRNGQRNIVFFLGANIGNFHDQLIDEFLAGVKKNLKTGDLLMIGFDLKKDPQIILKAYNDSKGITAAFNLNLLDRINRELGANFDLAKFTHFPKYDPLTGECKSYLVSTEAQEVNIGMMDITFHFKAWEPIYMEVSRKFGVEDIEQLANQAGFKIVKHIFDLQHYFCESIWKVM